MSKTLLAKSEILQALAITGDQFEYVVRHSGIPPAKRVGTRRYYSRQQVKQIERGRKSLRPWTRYETQFTQEQADDGLKVEEGTACPQ